MNIIQFLIRLVWRRCDTQPQTHSYILQLPLEVLLKIFAFLPPHSQLLVYQTCRPLRVIIHQYFLARRGEIPATPKDRLNYLTHLARSLPDRWTRSWDTPSVRPSYYPKCGDGKAYAFEKHSESKIFLNYEYSPAHRHVELTLKYTRLKSQKRTHWKHLKRLLTPHHAETQRPDYIAVVDGRYLLFTVRTYLGVGTTVSRKSIEFIEICPHLSSFAELRSRNGLKLDLNMILYMAFSAPPNTRTFYPCLACRTDVSIQISPERAIICAWQDLGPEGTVYDPVWEAIVRKTTNIHHQAGSIRELYGQHEHNGEIL
ncbi:hypothetical protein V8C37DRAFT_412177 [Trichoderma ceciliae]